MSLTRDTYINTPSPIEKELKAIFDTQESLIIFDIGSCEGEDSIKYSKIFPKSQIYAVEALPNNIDLLKQNLEKYWIKNVEVMPFALSDEKGTSKFYVSSGQPEYKQNSQDWDYGNKSSSLLAPDKHLDVIPWLTFQKVIDVETKRLKDVCIEQSIDHIDFIHMDVQGAEMKVLIGADELIRRVKAIWLEVEAVALYQNQPLKHEIEEFMYKNKFYKLKDTVDSVSGDQFYINLTHFSKDNILTNLSISEGEKNILIRNLNNIKKYLFKKKYIALLIEAWNKN